MASGSDLLPSTTVIATYNILAKSLGSNCIPWAIEIPPRLREKLEKATGKPWDMWRKEILHAAYKTHFHKNLHSGDYMTMRALWSATPPSMADQRNPCDESIPQIENSR